MIYCERERPLLIGDYNHKHLFVVSSEGSGVERDNREHMVLQYREEGGAPFRNSAEWNRFLQGAFKEHTDAEIGCNALRSRLLPT